MPNHIYTSITFHNELTEKQKEIMKQIVDLEGGLCEYYKPMPEEKRNTTESVLAKKDAIDNGTTWKDTTTWYGWAMNNWNTKWGTYENEYSGELFTFMSAWSLPSPEIFEMLAKDFPNFDIDFEEEQGWGGRIVFKNGKEFSHEEYDIPEWEEVGETKNGSTITRLVHIDIAHPRFDEATIGACYLDYCLDQQI